MDANIEQLNTTYLSRDYIEYGNYCSTGIGSSVTDRVRSETLVVYVTAIIKSSALEPPLLLPGNISDMLLFLEAVILLIFLVHGWMD